MDFPKKGDQEMSTKRPRKSDRTLASTYVLRLPVDRVLISDNIIIIGRLKYKGQETKRQEFGQRFGQGIWRLVNTMKEWGLYSR